MEFIIRHKNGVALVFFILFSLISLSVQSSEFTLSVEGILSTVVMPFQKAYHYTQKSIHKLWAGFTELSDLQEELDKTRDKLAQFEKIHEDINKWKIENLELRKQLHYKSLIEYESIPAIIISKDPDNWCKTIIINRGISDGIKVNMPVLAFNGDEKAVIGKVIEVRNGVSRILPLISTNMKIGVMLQESRYPGLMQGYSSNSELCVVDYINKSAAISLNETVITSGQGGVFPPGLVVGRVKKTIQLKSSAFQKIIVKPIVNYDLLEYVYVVKRQPNEDVIQLIEGSAQ